VASFGAPYVRVTASNVRSPMTTNMWSRRRATVSESNATRRIWCVFVLFYVVVDLDLAAAHSGRHHEPHECAPIGTEIERPSTIFAASAGDGGSGCDDSCFGRIANLAGFESIHSDRTAASSALLMFK
jgi:hypothetical protein